jgi:c-di-GMP-binding flagellar brake protein YcgR
MIAKDSFEGDLAIGDRVLVETDLYGHAVSFRSVLARICPTELWLGLGSPDRRIETIGPDQKLQLTIARTGAALVSRSTFLRPLGGGKSRVFAVVRPNVLERVQRRSYVRYQIDLPVHVRHLDPDTWEPRGKLATTITKDLSPGGLSFVSDAAINLGDDLDLTLPLSGLDRLTMNGVVKRLARQNDRGDSVPGIQPHYTEVAVKFTRITSLDQDRIVRIILLAEHRRRQAAMAGQTSPTS